MKNIASIFLLFFSILASAQKETVTVNIKNSKEMPLLLERAQNELAVEKEGRGLLSTGVSLAVQLGSRALAAAFTKLKNQYNFEWQAPVCRESFYNAPSFLGALDPSGLQFNGVTVTRYITNASGQDNQAFLLSCSVPHESIQEFITNHRFIMQIDTLMIDLSQIRAKYTLKKRVSIQIDLTFTATWMDDNTSTHNKQELGMFRINIPSLHYDKEAPIVSFGREQTGNMISGYCFFIPRSYSAFKSGENYMPCWSAGEFEVAVTVRESTSTISKGMDFFYDSVSQSLPNALGAMVTNKDIVGESVAEIIKTY